MIYKTFEEWKAGRWLEDGEPRTEAYTEDELLLIEMGWKYGFDAGKLQQALDADKDRAMDELVKWQQEFDKPVAWMIIDVDNGKSLQFKENKFSEINIPLYTAPQTLKPDASQNQGEEQMNDGYYCVVCGKYLPADEYGVIVHDDVPHPETMTFDEEDNPQ